MNTITLPESRDACVGQAAARMGEGEQPGKQQERQYLRDMLLAGAASGTGVTMDADYFASLRLRVRDAQKCRKAG